MSPPAASQKLAGAQKKITGGSGCRTVLAVGHPRSLVVAEVDLPDQKGTHRIDWTYVQRTVSASFQEKPSASKALACDRLQGRRRMATPMKAMSPPSPKSP